MRLPSPVQREEGENLIPLINIVFLLLIFFMLAGTFASPDPLKIDPPTSVSEAPADHEGMVVLLTSDGRLALGGEIIEPALLRQRVAAVLARDARAPIKLKADAATAASRLIDVMDSLREAGAERLLLMTVQGAS